VNLKPFPKKQRSQFRAITTKRSFTRSKIYHKIVCRLTQMVKFFGKDHVILCHVYLELKTLKGHFRDEERPQCDFNPEYAICFSTALSIIHSRRCKLLDQDSLKAAFWLTSFGCQSLSDNISFIPLPYQQDWEYHTPYLSPNAHGSVDGSSEKVHRSQDVHEQ
jgi:hypothetical protein